MGISVADYLIDQSGIDWPKALAPWSWLLPREFTLWRGGLISSTHPSPPSQDTTPATSPAPRTQAQSRPRLTGRSGEAPDATGDGSIAVDGGVVVESVGSILSGSFKVRMCRPPDRAYRIASSREDEVFLLAFSQMMVGAQTGLPR